MTTQPKYNRVEIIADLGFGIRVILFADFSSQGISMGIPHHVIILKGTPEQPSTEPIIDEMQRTTTHADGRVKTHWPVPPGKNIKTPWEVSRPALNSWTNPVLQKEELYWGDENKYFLDAYLIKPKRKESSPRTLQIPVVFISGINSSVATFTILKPGDLVEFMANVPEPIQAWQITGGWPLVILTFSNVVNPNHAIIAEAGRIYT